MYSAEDYFWGWTAYITGALCLLFVSWYLMRNLRFSWGRHILIILTAIFLLTPVAAYTDDPRLAPAFFVSFYEGFVSNPDTGFQRGAAPIVALMVFGLVGYLLLRLLVWKVKKPKALKAEH